MRKKYFILAITFLCLFVGQNSYASDWNELDEVVVTGPGSNDSNDPCDPFSTAYDYFTCNPDSGNGSGYDSGDPCDYYSSAYNQYICDSNNDSWNPCDPSSSIYNYSICYGSNGDNGGTTDPEPPVQTDPDPCYGKLEAEEKSNSIPNNMQSSVANALDAASAIDGFEHGITFGKDANGSITQAPMRDGGIYNVPVTQNWPGAFACVHNHVVDYPPSAGDVYTAVTLVSNNSNFTTSYINLPNGNSYAIVVTNPTLAKDFVAKYPKDQIGNNPPEFPDFIFNQLQDLVTQMGSTVEGRINAIVATLDKNNSGISFLKKDSVSGLFEKIAIKQTTTNGVTTYQEINCP